MIPKQLDRIEKADIDNLISNAVEESRTIEYKQALPSNADKDKKEFLADVSSFANATGGDLLFGIEEQRDADGKPTGVPVSAPGLAVSNADAEILRIESIIRSGIGPRLAGVHIRKIDAFPNGPVILIRIQKSYASPHMVTFQEHSRFYSRNSRGKYPLDVGEIRSAFALSESLPEKIRRFRDERLARVVAGDTFVRLPDGPKVILHILPISALDVSKTVDVSKVAQLTMGLKPIVSHGHGSYNFAGYISSNLEDRTEICKSYAQFFRSGAIEAVDGRLLANRNGDKVFPDTAFVKYLIAAVSHYIGVYRQIEIQPPIVLLLSLLGVKGYFIAQGRFNDTAGVFDQNDMILPDILIEDAAVDVAELLRPTFNTIWQASGWQRCFLYDESGILRGDNG